MDQPTNSPVIHGVCIGSSAAPKRPAGSPPKSDKRIKMDGQTRSPHSLDPERPVSSIESPQNSPQQPVHPSYAVHDSDNDSDDNSDDRSNYIESTPPGGQKIRDRATPAPIDGPEAAQLNAREQSHLEDTSADSPPNDTVHRGQEKRDTATPASPTGTTRPNTPRFPLDETSDDPGVGTRKRGKDRR
jgi:hypothetical protein